MVYTLQAGISREKTGRLSLFFVALALAITSTLAIFAAGVSAAHNPAVVEHNTVACGETTFSASVTDPEGTHLVDNMQLVVHADGVTQNEVIPTDGSSVEITVGPFDSDQTIMWRVFGGGERNYDQPLWNGHGEPGFTADINAYGADNGFGFVVAGPDDPNPFTTWNELEVEGCPLTKDDCKQGGWIALGFSNQGRCIQYVNTGKDSR
jgi:hypothetical protein